MYRLISITSTNFEDDIAYISEFNGLIYAGNNGPIFTNIVGFDGSEIVRTVAAHHSINTCILGTTDYLYVGNEKGNIQCFDRDLNFIFSIPSDSAVTTLLLHSDGNIYSGHDDGKIMLVKDAQLYPIRGFPNTVTKMITYGDYICEYFSNILAYFDPTDGTTIFMDDHENKIEDIVVFGDYCCSSSKDLTIRFWNDRGEMVTIIRVDCVINHLAAHASYLYGAGDGELRRYDIHGNECFRISLQSIIPAEFNTQRNVVQEDVHMIEKMWKNEMNNPDDLLISFRPESAYELEIRNKARQRSYLHNMDDDDSDDYDEFDIGCEPKLSSMNMTNGCQSVSGGYIYEMDERDLDIIENMQYMPFRVRCTCLYVGKHYNNLCVGINNGLVLVMTFQTPSCANWKYMSRGIKQTMIYIAIIAGRYNIPRDMLDEIFQWL